MDNKTIAINRKLLYRLRTLSHYYTRAEEFQDIIHKINDVEEELYKLEQKNLEENKE